MSFNPGHNNNNGYISVANKTKFENMLNTYKDKNKDNKDEKSSKEMELKKLFSNKDLKVNLRVIKN